MQTPTDAHTNTFITEQYEVLYDAYVADRALVPKGSLAEVRFEDLDADPVGTMQRIYEQFGWAAGERAAAGGEAGGKSGGRAGKGGGRGGSANGGVRASGGGGGGASFDEVRPLFEAYAATLGDFKKNHLGKLNAADEAAVRARWAASFNEFGYS